jgi:hypothetical protein
MFLDGTRRKTSSRMETNGGTRKEIVRNGVICMLHMNTTNNKLIFYIFYKKFVDKTMSSSLMPSYLDPDIFVNHISSMLYKEHLENLYWTCRSMHTELEKSGKYIYKKICLHHTPTLSPTYRL